MARQSPVARNEKREPVAHIGGYSAPIDTTGMESSMKETMEGGTPFRRRVAKLEDILRRIMPKKKTSKSSTNTSPRHYTLAEADSILRVKK